MKYLLISDTHLMNDPAELTKDQMRKQWFPWLFTKKWLPYWLIRWFGRHILCNRALKAFIQVGKSALQKQCDYIISLGDQIHGIAERGMVGSAGQKVAKEFLSLCKGISHHGTLFHVSSEHPLGYWEGVDYFPHLKKWKFTLEIHRDIGGRLDTQAISNWQELFGPLWGTKEIEGFTFVWINCDLIRWRERILHGNEPKLQELLRQQDQFLQKTFESARPGKIILFTHRPDAVFDSDIIRSSQSKLNAVVFGDCHIQKQADKIISRFPHVSFKWYFVPAVWGVVLGVGKPRYAILEIKGEKISFSQHVA